MQLSSQFLKNVFKGVFRGNEENRPQKFFEKILILFFDIKIVGNFH